ncbi:hypothetical protein K469DRAFT_234969 [Zopfia rhizophila CBS 207.26]|uniref:Uncharacterized protein n=1 Tax=Zopfia rhizophila CBS 207.26 TaxID=1314779 RepID=A0A6A6ERF2_9PEZI|nr:hypothetical protein K469DRAFT_234969 [Zopfia rhizophila CBS 207.26]
MTFKIILIGITDRIRGEMLRQCLMNSSIAAYHGVSCRRSRRLKLDIVAMKGFTMYSDELLAKLSGSDGCKWYAIQSGYK